MTDELNRKEDDETIEKQDNESSEEIALASQNEELPIAQENSQRVCKRCGNPEIEAGYTIDFCKNCREELSKLHLPIWVKGFALLVSAILIFALVKFPNTLSTGISYEKGIRFEQEKKYMSAMNEYETVVNTFPDSTEALCKLFITQYKAGRIGPASTTYQQLIGRDVKDDQLYEEVVKCFNQIDSWYYPTTEYYEILSVANNLSIEEIKEKVTEYVNKHPDDVYPQMDLAGIYLNDGETEKGKSILINILKNNPDFVDCSFYLASIYRQTKEYDKALELYNKMLLDNVERADAISAIARIEIKRGNEKPGLDMALKAYEIDNVDSFVLSNLILAYHYNNLKAERDKAFDLLKSQGNYSEADLALLTGIINGTDTEWRD